MKCEFVNPLADPEWNSRVLEFTNATAFHSAEWARVLAESYRFTPQYAVLSEGGRCTGILPLMDIQSVWTGRRGVCLPFSDECGALLRSEATLDALIGPIRDHGLNLGWNFLEIRGDCGDSTDLVSTEEFWNHRILLTPNQDLQRQLRDSNQRNIQKARKEGVEVLHLESREALTVFYKLHCNTRRGHGLPPQPFRFFRLIHEHLVERGFAFFTLARLQEKWIAGALFLHFGSRGIYKFGASDPAYLQVRPNNLVMWEAIGRLRDSGVNELSLGRTDFDDAGLLQFKRGWGALETKLFYFQLALRKPIAGNTRRQPHQSLLSPLIRQVPIPILRVLGSLAYRHMA